MTILGISAAARAAGVNRSTLQRAIKTGRLSATIDAAGERGIDLAELLRVFGPLRQMRQEDPAASPQPAAPIAAADAAGVELLKEQLRQAQEREQQARERERQFQDRENQLLALLRDAQRILADEQQARRDLETKLLPAPRPAPVGKVRAWILLAVLVVVLAFAGWWFRAVTVSWLAS
jgi:hypothetical protein